MNPTQVLEWYQEQAASLARYAEEQNTDAMMAVVTSLSLDGGKRAAEAIAQLINKICIDVQLTPEQEAAIIAEVPGHVVFPDKARIPTTVLEFDAMPATPAIGDDALAELSERINAAPSEDENTDVIAQVFLAYMEQRGARLTFGDGWLRIWHGDQYITKITTWKQPYGHSMYIMLDLHNARAADRLLTVQQTHL